MPNSIDFYKGIFLHVIPVRMIVPCFKEHLQAAVSARFFVLRKQSPEGVKKDALKNLRKLSRKRP